MYVCVYIRIYSAVYSRFMLYTCYFSMHTLPLRYSYIYHIHSIGPAENLYVVPFRVPALTCIPSKIFTEWYTQELLWGIIKIRILPIQIHGLCYGLFASLVAPFGGFLASAIKRAYHKKDYDNFIPGI